jgi:hypothetical protein
MAHNLIVLTLVVGAVVAGGDAVAKENDTSRRLTNEK